MYKSAQTALRLMSAYRLVIDEIKDAKAVRSYTRWVDAVQVRGAENQEVYVTFSPRFEPIWLKSKKRLLEYVAEKPAIIGLRSQYALRLYGWAKEYVTLGTKRIPLEHWNSFAKCSAWVKVPAGNIIQEAPSPFAGLGRTAPESAGYRDRGDQ